VRGATGTLGKRTELPGLLSRRLWPLASLLFLLVAAAAAGYIMLETNLFGTNAPPTTVAVVMPAPVPARAASAPVATATPSESPASAAALSAQESVPAIVAPLPVVPPTPPVQTAAAKAIPPPVTAARTVQAANASSTMPVPVPVPAVVARPPAGQSKTQAQTVAATPTQQLASAGRVEADKAATQISQRQPSGVSSPRATNQAVAVAPAASPGRARATTVAAAVQKPANVASTSNTSSTSSSQLQRQRAAQETLARAQNLWAAGSREQALELMREAVAVTERAYNAGTLPADSPVLASLVRELARMELAEGRVSVVLELLTRLEPALSGQADLWAVRGNAAQRLARHQEAVQAYLKALELRPDEPRWMLGAAVSLAALGRLDTAAEQVERARSLGAVSPEILAYLRQAGVPLK